MDYTETVLCLFGILVSLLLRICTSFHPYSGHNKPPMYGDYEAQRHWMEITVNLPAKQWYYNSSDNDLMYWGLDYPPLTAYHSLLCGFIAKYINPGYVELHKSRGYESESHKLFMRYTVLIADILVYFPAVILFFNCTKYLHLQRDVTVQKQESNEGKARISPQLAVIIALLYPGLILTDHGHFQYNCVSLGFMIFAVAFACGNRHILSSIFFCLALNYKQMELYHAFPFFLYLLSSCIPKPGMHILSGIFKLSKIGLTVILTFGVIWSPFIFSLKDLFQVLDRLFPVARGVFEDKVANFWCTINSVIRLKKLYCNEDMLRICMSTTLIAILPSSIDLFVRPNVKKFVPALINSALAFFLFSFQVHEKSILLVAIPVMLHLPDDPIMCFWFLTVSTFTMFPLFVKDELIIAFYAVMAFFVIATLLIMDHAEIEGDYADKFRNFIREFLDIWEAEVRSYKELYDNQFEFLKVTTMIVCSVLSTFLFSILTVLPLLFEPPANYSDLYPYMITCVGSLHFIMFFIYFNYVQLIIPQGFEYISTTKVKKQ